jgi:hypothetical protein
MYLIRFCVAYLLFIVAILILQLFPSIDLFFFEKPPKSQSPTEKSDHQPLEQIGKKDKTAA